MAKQTQLARFLAAWEQLATTVNVTMYHQASRAGAVKSKATTAANGRKPV